MKFKTPDERYLSPVAVREFLEKYGSFYEMNHVRNARQPSLILKKVRVC